MPGKKQRRVRKSDQEKTIGKRNIIGKRNNWKKKQLEKETIGKRN